MRNKKKCRYGLTVVFALLFYPLLSGAWARDFLTDQEITRMQKTQDIDRRTDIYMAAATLRLRSAQDRFEGKESEPGDAMEFYSQEDMLGDYYKIIERVMLIVGDAFESPRSRENVNIKKALNKLKSKSSDNLKRLFTLQKLAEEKQKEDLWHGINRAIDITGGVLDGAEEGLSALAKRERP
ncbi:MAG: hypothetical protein LBJ21_02565 [Acidobacteriota bacterium]|jgi:hypothetical protein|nr:hypothetical protein [Acidobacteriota bacterium]